MDRLAFMQHNLDYSLEFGSIRFPLNFVEISLCCEHGLNQLPGSLPCFVNIWKIEHISNFYFQDRTWLPTLTDITI